MNTRLLRPLQLSALIALAYGFAVPAAYAQSAAKQISGAIHDALGHPLPDATVALKDASGNAVGSTRSDQQGHFVFSDIAPGIYAISVGKLSFQ